MNVENGYVQAPLPEGIDLKDEIIKLKKQKQAVVLAHYYQQGEIQDVADFIGDSLALAREAEKLDAPVVVMCGVHFMGETVKILCPDKKVLCPDLNAGCSLADSCPAPEFQKFIEAHPGHTVISYVNTSAAVKALTDIVVTSGNAQKIVAQLPEDEKIIFGPDRNLGTHIMEKTGREMVLWDGACHVHERFSLKGILDLKKQHPQAQILVHPECPRPVRMIADVVGSTAVLLNHAVSSENQEFIIATESGILHELKRKAPDKVFYPAPGDDSTCGCNNCSYMKLNTLEKLYLTLLYEAPEIHVDPAIIDRARIPITRMLQMS